MREQQYPDGGFAHQSGTSPTDFSNAISRRTTFFTANIVLCLQNIPRPESAGHADMHAKIRNAGIKFLLSEKSDRWSFNYWACSSPEQTTLPYPDDLDDTFAALAAIIKHDASLLNGHAFAAIAALLTGREVREGGPYRTWLVGDTAPTTWQDVDVAVNGTIAYFLSLAGVRLPRLHEFIDDAVREGHLISRYYSGIFPVAYFISRSYQERAVAESAESEKLVAMIAVQLHPDNLHRLTTLECAMGITSLLNLRCRNDIVRTVINHLIARLEKEGFLPSAFCIDPAQNGARCYAGASALTAAICAEALARYAATAPDAALSTPRAILLHLHIQNAARKLCRPIGNDLRITAIRSIEKTSDARITSLAYEFYKLIRADGTTIVPDILEQLSLANFFGWMAYEIYDNVLDGEAGGAEHGAALPCANFFLREVSEIYHSLPGNTAEISGLFENIMNGIDNANAWEQRHCLIRTETLNNEADSFSLPHFGDHGTLADRSMGHALGPLAELLIAGYAPDEKIYKNTELFFRHYLIARQLHDDAHDWAEDLLRGRINSVSVLIIRHFKEKNPAAAMPSLAPFREIFWGKTIDVVMHIILRHIGAARRVRNAITLPGAEYFLENELIRLEAIARRAIKERDNAIIFLADYKGIRATGAAP